MNPSTSLKITPHGEREIRITRVFNAPRRLVYEAMSQPELIRRWLAGPPGWSMVACENDARPGGSFRWAWRGPEGMEMSMHGVYREVVAPERQVRTEIFDTGCEGQAGEQLGTLVLREQGGQTTAEITVLYPSQQARDATLASGMEHGMAASYQQLDALLAASAPQPR